MNTVEPTAKSVGKVPRSIALDVARELCAALKPCCEKLVVAGSLRRGKVFVSDVEILFQPKFEERDVPGDMFASQQVNLADAAIAELESKGVIQRRKNSLGYETWGPLNKLALHYTTGVPVDFFAVLEPANWWNSLVIRTGSIEMNLELTKGAIKLGRSLQAYGSGVIENGHVIPAHDEREVFNLCGVEFRLPKDR